MIKSIQMKNCATYNREGASIDDCVKVNFIYGANGSGKSTIGNYLNNQNDENFSECEIECFDEIKNEIFVYNKEFRRVHLGNSNIPGVFTLGKSTKEDIETIEKLKKGKDLLLVELKSDREVLSRKKKEQEGLKSSFKESIWNAIFKKYEVEFAPILSKYKTSKEKFYVSVIEKFQSGIRNTCEISDLQRLVQTLFFTEDASYDLLPSFPQSFVSDVNGFETHYILQKVVVGNEDLAIGELIKKRNNSDWVNEGRLYMEGMICPFCQKPTITHDFQNELEAFFSGQFIEDKTVIEELRNAYSRSKDYFVSFMKDLLQQVTSIKILNSNMEILKELNEKIIQIFNGNLLKLEVKGKEPSRKIHLESSNSYLTELVSQLVEINKIIKAHNDLMTHRKEERAKLSIKVWGYLIEQQREMISAYWSQLQGVLGAINKLEKKCSELNQTVKDKEKQIIEAEKNVTSVQPTIDEINRLLNAFGFTGFKIVPSLNLKNYYQIQRDDGTLVESTLSEGEETFIAFLYYLQVSKGAWEEGKISSKRILVIDDPICSLDSNILFVVSTLIKDLIEKIRHGESDVEQIFILTHNLYFHKETSYFDGRKNNINDVHYWILKKRQNVTSIKAYGSKNPIKSSYELLWEEIRDEDRVSIVSLRNAMRRILESYFSLLGEKWNSAILKKFDNFEEQIICKSLLSWLDDGSHTVSEDLFVDDNVNAMEQYKLVFCKIFKEMGQEAHYKMMMGID